MKKFALILAISALMSGCGRTGTTTTPTAAITVTIFPTAAAVKTGESHVFTATVLNTSNTAVTWSVNGVAGGNSTVGTISSVGLYTAPELVPNPATVTVTVTSNADNSKSASATVTLSLSRLVITNASLANGVVGTVYSATLQTNGGAPPVTWSYSGTLPTGLSLNTSTGVISGTPTAAGTFDFTITAVDSSTPQKTANQPLSITINPLLAITTTSLANGVVNTAYSATLQSTGGVGAITWSVTSGSLPAGLTLSSSGTLSGTPTAAGTFNFTATATDSGTPQQTKNQPLSITIYAGLTITTTSLPDGVANAVYGATVQTVGGQAPLTWSVPPGVLPAGLALDTATGAISGTPTATGTASFTVTVTDSGTPQQTKNQSLDITINPALAITTTVLDNGVVGTAYSQTLQSSGGGGAITWSVTVGSLPAGLGFNASTGVISGTPTTAATTNFTVTATDSAHPAQTVNKALSITIYAGLAITTTSLPDGVQNAAYTATVQSAGGVAPLTWSVPPGSLPVGLSLNTSTGVISGTPTAAGTASFTVTVTDSGTPQQTKNQLLSVTIDPVLAITTTSPLPNGVVGAAYSQTLQASGGGGAITWGVTVGSLPAGLSLNASTGVISGPPTTAGTTNFTVTATDSAHPAQTISKALSITINPLLAITTTSLPGGTVNSVYSTTTLQSSGGVSPITWGVTIGTLSAGLSLNTSTGAISGTPTASGSANFTVTATDSGTPQQTKNQALSIVINPALSITTTSLPDGTVGTAYSQNIQSSGGTPTILWSVTVGSLPTGLSLGGNPAGYAVVSGTPTATGTFNFTVTATDNSNPQQNVNQPLSITINNTPLNIITMALPDAVLNVAYTQTVQSAGGTPPVAWSTTVGSLPAGLSLNTSTGEIAGTPTAAGTFPFTVRATDSTTPTAQHVDQSLSITVNSAVCTSTGHESVLSGSYAFSLAGYNASGFQAVVGSFTADGSGHITAGQADANGISLGPQSGLIDTATSTYSVGADNRGCATIVIANVGTFATRFALGTLSSNVATQGRMMEFDPPTSTAYIATGEILKQTLPAALSNGNYVYQLTGVFGSVHKYRAGDVGVITVSGGSFSDGEYDLTVAQGTHTNHQGTNGTYTTPDAATGRYTYQTWLASAPTLIVNHVAYLVSGSQFLELTADPLSTLNALLIGKGQLQSGPLNNSSVSGNSVFYMMGLGGGGSGGGVDIGLASADGSGSITITDYHDEAGSSQTQNFSCTYSVASDGRMTLSGASCGSGAPVFYLTAASKGFMLSLDTGVEVGQVEPQVGSNFTTASVSGNFYFGDVESVSQGQSVGAGVAILNGSGGVTVTNDRTSTTTQSGDETGSLTITVNSDGTFSDSENPGVVTGIIISSTKVVSVDNQNDTYPAIQVIKQ